MMPLAFRTPAELGWTEEKVKEGWVYTTPNGLRVVKSSRLNRVAVLEGVDPTCAGPSVVVG